VTFRGIAAFFGGKRSASTVLRFLADVLVVLPVVLLIRITRFGRQRLLGET